ncbi:sensor histidine kinase [Bifidobacterium eulemuris]|nr:GHKL domain-containing protein [Bifidobacterium eulemuris]
MMHDTAALFGTGDVWAPLVGFFNTVGFLLELVTALVMFVWPLERRPRFVWRAAAAMLVMMAVCMVWDSLASEGTWWLIARCFLIYAMCCAASRVCWRVSFTQALFYMAAAAALQHAVYRGARVLSTRLHMVWEDAAWIDTIVYAALVVPLFALGYWLFARPLVGKSIEGVASGRMLLLFTGMAICLNIFTNLYHHYGSGSVAFTIFSLFDLLTCVFMLMLLREIVEHENAERDGAMLRQLMNQQKAKLDSDKATIDLINVKTHDLKRQLNLLENRIPQEEIDDLKSLAGIYDATVRTGNETLDVLLSNRSLVCEQRGIQFDRIIDGERLEFMKPGDIYSLFGNAVDNAMEAVEHIADDGRRWIRMTVRANKGMVVMHIENPYDGALTFRDGLPQTVKADRHYHGFGLKSMRMVAEQYGGALSVKADEGIFAVNVVLPIER